MTRARSVFERCVNSSLLHTPGGAASSWQRVAGEVQRDNVFDSSVVKLCLRRYGLDLILHTCASFYVFAFCFSLLLSVPSRNVGNKDHWQHAPKPSVDMWPVILHVCLHFTC